MMDALIYTDVMNCEFAPHDQPVSQPGHSVIDVSFCGICGSDMHAWHGHDARRVPPLILGHEIVGRAIDGPMAGQLVAVNPLMTCGTCQYCLKGSTHLCQSRELLGMRLPGGFAQFVSVKDTNLTPLSGSISLTTAALAEPLACSVHAMRLMTNEYQASRSDRMVILGGGAIGLLAALHAKHLGYQDIHIAEVNDTRRKLLNQIVGVDSYNPLETQPDEHSISMVFDAVGSGRTRAASCELVSPGGMILHIGLQDSELGFDSRYITLQEVTFKGSYCYNEADFAEAVSLLESGHITGDGWCDVRPLKVGQQAFMDIHEGNAPPKIILETS
ncbi:MAG: alcohol dehydrogenase catalytic domain-containing protein [Candidatus Puniceispirillaceae bacterium]